jgi:CDGSH-type Zn-finger protein
VRTSSEAPTGNAGPDERAARAEQAARLVLTSEGPVLVSGPVNLELPDGRHVSSRRPVTAVCTCRRSRRYPFCDASHRVPVETASVPTSGTRP